MLERDGERGVRRGMLGFAADPWARVHPWRRKTFVVLQLLLEIPATERHGNATYATKGQKTSSVGICQLYFFGEGDRTSSPRRGFDFGLFCGLLHPDTGGGLGRYLFVICPYLCAPSPLSACDLPIINIYGSNTHFRVPRRRGRPTATKGTYQDAVHHLSLPPATTTHQRCWVMSFRRPRAFLWDVGVDSIAGGARRSVCTHCRRDVTRGNRCRWSRVGEMGRSGEECTRNQHDIDPMTSSSMRGGGAIGPTGAFFVYPIILQSRWVQVSA
ncbi:hypothetical protein FA13DRAFT_1073709 [Coprinellus micaceus]|uniref:Uncharacterized protein n=1 Tax=Coprinellus micaceus TaxID=71717 RepID=A0A4Y7TST5_COPMI|nr:hypothetical protein FA13DRAFT_1073709 [Coprinellus micaceus]